MDITERQIRSRIFFYIGVAILAVKVFFSYSAFFSIPERLDQAMVLLGVLCLVLKIVFQQYNMKSILCVAAIGVIACVCALNSRDYAALLSVLVICSFQWISIESFIKEMLWIKAGFILIHVVLYGIRYWLDSGQLSILYRNGEMRHSFGMTHANFFAMMICWMLLEWIYLNFERLSWIMFCGGLIVQITVFAFTLSRTGFLIVMLALVMIGLSKWSSAAVWVIRQASMYTYTGLMLLSLWIAQNYFETGGIVKKILLKVNDMLTGRLNMWAVAYHVYGFAPLGQRIIGNGKMEWNETYQITQLIVDNTYIYFAVKCGMLLAVMFGFLFFLVGREKMPKKNIMIVAMSVFAIMESFSSNIFLCFPLSFIGYRIYYQNEIGSNDE